MIQKLRFCVRKNNLNKVKIPRVVLKDNPADKVGQDSARKGKHVNEVETSTDQRCDGIATEVVDQVQDRQELISFFLGDSNYGISQKERSDGRIIPR